MATILITGGSGLIGTTLTKALVGRGDTVRHLSRSADHTNGPVRSFAWSVGQRKLDPTALDDVDHIVHLAGAGIADARWSAERVKVLIESRATSALFLLQQANQAGVAPKSFVSAAGINYYGAVTSDTIFQESAPAGTDTIGRISKEWETAVDAWTSVSRVVKLRTPVVLSAEGGALTKLALPVRFGLGSALGTGDQWMPWVHVDDLVSIYQRALFDDGYNGAYNLNAPDHVTNDAFMRTVARVLKRPYFLPRVPGFALKLALGELSSILLEGSRADNQRLLSTGFQFQHPILEGALRDVLGKP